MTATVNPPSPTRLAHRAAAPTPGQRATASPVRSRSEFRPLSDRIRELRLLDPRPGWYVGYALAIGAALALTATGMVLLRDSWWVVALAPVAALVWSQISYLGHDVGHHQVTKSPRLIHVFGTFLGNVLTGLSFGWWQDKHNRHHSNPNVEDHDPDVAEGIISWSDKQQAKKTGFARWFSRHQAVFFFPLLTFEGMHLQVAGLLALKERPRAARAVEAVLLVMHHVAYIGGLVWLLGPAHAAVFIVVHQALWGFLLGCAFAPNHKGMEMPPAGTRLNHLRKQVLTSRDVEGGPVIDLLLGGLNHQVTHHLFPSMARPHLREAQKVVAAYCADIGLPYRACGVLESYRQCLTHLDDVGHSS